MLSFLLQLSIISILWQPGKVFSDSGESPDSPLCLLWYHPEGERWAHHFCQVGVEIQWHQWLGGPHDHLVRIKAPHSLLSLLWHLLTVLQEHPWENAGCTLGSGPSTYWGVSPCLIALYIKLMVEALMWQLALLLVLALWSWVNHVTSLGLSFPISSVGRNDANLRLCLWEHLPQILNTNKY